MSDTPEPEEQTAVIRWLTNTFDPWLESKKASNTLIIFFVLLMCIPVIGVGLATTRTILPLDQMHISIPSLPAIKTGTARANGTTFTCAGGKSIEASFSLGLVELTLSDGRTLTLPQVSSEQYGNPDGSFVFQNTDTTASISEHGVETYKNCDS